MNRLRSACVALVLSGALLFVVGCDSNDDPEGVRVTGSVANAASLGGLPVSGATVTFTEASNAAPAGAAAARAAVTATTDADGAFSARVEPGAYTVTVARPGYEPVTRSVTVDEGFSLDEVLSGSVTISGTLANSQGTGSSGLGGARVVFLFEDALSGSALEAEADLETTADAGGAFTFPNAPYGLFTCVVYADGFVPAVLDGIDIPAGGGSVALNPAVVTERPPEGAYRIVLSWGAEPTDLDSHLTGPDGQGGRFHIYYFDEAFGDSNLDVDDITSFGPETITLFPDVDGVYRYSVHNYSDRFQADGALGIAGEVGDGQPARVEVYFEDQLLRSYRAPDADADDGDTWRVFEMTVNGDDVSFNGNPPGGLGYTLVDDEDDGGQFLTGPFQRKESAR